MAKLAVSQLLVSCYPTSLLDVLTDSSSQRKQPIQHLKTRVCLEYVKNRNKINVAELEEKIGDNDVEGVVGQIK